MVEMAYKNSDVLDYVHEVERITKAFPHDKIGRFLASMLPQILESGQFSEYVKKNPTANFVIPEEPVQNYPPVWGDPSHMDFYPRKHAQKYALAYLDTHPILYISSDGGIYEPKGSRSSPPMVRLSLALQNPLNFDQVVSAKSSIASPSQIKDARSSIYMNQGEFRQILCVLKQLFAEPIKCGDVGCPFAKENCTSCPNKQIDLNVYQGLITEKKLSPVVFLDRPVMPSYLRFAGEDKSLSRLYKELLDFCKDHSIPVLSVLQSSNSQSLIKTVLDIMAGRNFQQDSFLFQPLLDFLDDNPNLINLDELDPQLKQKYNLTQPVDFIRYLRDQQRTRSLYNIIFDYSIFRYFLTGMEFRSNSFRIRNSTLQSVYKGIEFHFFYVKYGESWARVEFVNATPQEAATHYYIQSCIGKNYYPYIIQVAHEKAVIRTKFGRAVSKLLQSLGYNIPTLKALSKS